MSKTIAALATPPGVAGLSVIRLSGDESFNIADRVFKGSRSLKDCKSHSIHYGKIEDGKKLIDTVTASIFKAPNSYTGEDIIEFGCHGGNLIANMILELLYENGAAIPDPGEYTKRAFLNGKLDLAQVEAVSDLIHAVSVPGAANSARQLDGRLTQKMQSLRKELLEIAGLLELELDFAEEDLEFIPPDKITQKINEAKNFCKELISTFKGSEILRNGFNIAIAGYPNSGKSTLFNALADKDRAIVSEIEGTTRDYIEEFIYLENIPAKIIDTAGIRESDDVIEIQGIKLVESVLAKADVILVLNDIVNGANNSDQLFSEIRSKYEQVILVQNKADLTDNPQKAISAKTGEGISELKKQLYDIAYNSTKRTSDALINSRHKDLLERTVRDLDKALESLDLEMDNEIIAIDIRSAVKTIGEITGEAWNEEVLDHIFSGFCIGK